MMRLVLIAGVLALTAACTFVASTPTQSRTAAATGCGANASGHWQADANTNFTLEAQSFGADCAKAVAVIVIRDAQGDVQWAEAAPAAHIMTLAQAHDVAAMQTALGEWINSSNHTIASSSALPEWPRGANGPQNGEFPFHPEEGADRQSYEALRAANVPVYCYVQGMESQACLALTNGALEKAGVQSFPG